MAIWDVSEEYDPDRMDALIIWGGIITLIVMLLLIWRS